MAKRNAPDPALARSAEPLYREIRAILESARAGAYRAVNAAMVQAYWQVGRLIVEHEQDGERRAAYGEAVLEELARRPTAELGRGFDERNLRYMRQFYFAFQERPLASRKKEPVRQEAAAKLATIEPEQFIRDPYVLEFLDLKDYPALRESTVEQAIIANLQAFLLELGKGFSFVARQKRMRFDDIAKYSVLSENRQIFAAKYVKILPTERELTREIERERRLIDARQAGEEPA